MHVHAVMSVNMWKCTLFWKLADRKVKSHHRKHNICFCFKLKSETSTVLKSHLYVKISEQFYFEIRRLEKSEFDGIIFAFSISLKWRRSLKFILKLGRNLKKIPLLSFSIFRLHNNFLIAFCEASVPYLKSVKLCGKYIFITYWTEFGLDSFMWGYRFV